MTRWKTVSVPNANVPGADRRRAYMFYNTYVLEYNITRPTNGLYTVAIRGPLNSPLRK